jgi:hypothetical protein
MDHLSSAGRQPEFVRYIPAEAERFGAAAAIVLAHIRFRCDGDGWWRVSVVDLAYELGLSVQTVRTALEKRLAGVVMAQRFAGTDDTTKAYRLAADLPFVSSNKPQDAEAPVCCQQQDPLLAATNAPLLENSREQRTQTSSVQESNSQREDHDMKDPNQDGLPGMHLMPLPTNQNPVPAEAPKRGTRLPEDWMPPLDVVAQMRAECPNVDQALALRKFRDYWSEKVGKDATKLTWKGTYRNWIRNAATDYPRNSAGRSGISAVDQKALGWQGIGR